MGKRYSDGDINDIPDYDGVNNVKNVSIGIKNNLKIILLLLLIPVIGLGGYFGYITTLKEPSNNNAFIPVVSDNQEDDDNTSEYIGGYQVIGNVKIDSVQIDAKILNPEIDNISYVDDALKYGVVKLYGDKINEIGNVSLIAHDTSEFARLKDVLVGEKIIITNEKNESMNYTVTEIMHVAPDDLTVLLTNEYEAEITLITCEEGATTRLVVKAVNN